MSVRMVKFCGGGVALFLTFVLVVTPASATIYYVSSLDGDDGNTGTTTGAAFATLDHVNGLALQPGDEVRLLCGQTWRVDPLIVTDSGTSGLPIVFGSEPADCSNPPLLMGSQPISGWSAAGPPNLWVADLDLGANTGLFPDGISQLFRSGNRLPFGRWPNRGGHPDGGYSEIDAQPAGDLLTDGALPAGSWAGAVAHIKGIRWYILNREVDASAPGQLDLAVAADCWGGCAGWGYWLSNHLQTLDREGEWFWDEATNEVYLYSTSAPTSGEVEGSVVITADGRFHGGVELGNDLQEEVAWVTIENLRIERWDGAGVTYPVNLQSEENHDLVLRDLEIRDVDGAGVRLATWIWDAKTAVGPTGWRGGRNLLVEDVTIERATHHGITGFFRLSTIQDSVIRDVGRIEDLGRSGMGCGFDTVGQCTESGDGLRIQWSSTTPSHSGHDNLIRRNRLETIGMNGMDVFGPNNTIENNVFVDICASKGDCGAVRTYGGPPLGSSPVHDIVLRGNIVRGVEGNTDGCRADFDPLFGLGLYIDQYSRDIVVEDNTVEGATWVGILFQNSTGTASGNVLYGNTTTSGGGAFALADGGGVTSATLSANTALAVEESHRVLRTGQVSLIASSEGNRWLSPWNDLSFKDDTMGGLDLSLAGWQAHSGLDATSTAHWWSQGPGEASRAALVVNETGAPADLDPGPPAWLDLDQQPVIPPVTVPAWSSQIFVAVEGSIFADGFESGSTSRW